MGRVRVHLVLVDPGDVAGTVEKGGTRPKGTVGGQVGGQISKPATTNHHPSDTPKRDGAVDSEGGLARWAAVGS